MHSDISDALEFLERRLQKLSAAKTTKIDWELFAAQNEGLEIEVKNRRCKSRERFADRGLSLRLFQNGRVAFSYAGTLNRNSLAKMLENTRDILQLLESDPERRLPPLPRTPYPNLRLWDEHFSYHTDDDKMALARDLEATARRTDKRITQVDSASYSEQLRRTYLRNSRGLFLEHRETAYLLSLTALASARRGAETQSASEVFYSPFFADLAPKILAQNTARRALEALGAKPLQSGRYALVLENKACAELLETLEPSLSALAYLRNMSFLSGQLTQKVFADTLTLIDDATLDKKMGSAPFDGEGTPCAKITLIENGVLKSLLCDSYAAAKLKCESTGHLHRSSPRTLPAIGATNLFFRPGMQSADAIVADLKKAILVREFLGLHMANLNTGQFSFGASGFLIEKGRITRPVRDFTVSGNFLEFFNQVSAVANDLEFSGNFGSPSICFHPQMIGGQ